MLGLLSGLGILPRGHTARMAAMSADHTRNEQMPARFRQRLQASLPVVVGGRPGQATCGFDADAAEPPRSQLRRAPLVIVAYVFAGRGRFRDRHQQVEVGPGSLVLRLPDRDQHLVFDPRPRFAKSFLCLPPAAQAPLQALGLIDDRRPVRQLPLDPGLVATWYETALGWRRLRGLGPAAVWEHCLRLLAAVEAVERRAAAEGGDPLDQAARRLAQDHRAVLDLRRLAAGLGCNYHSFRRAFQQRFGCAPAAWRQRHRMQHACTLLAAHDVTRTAERLGYATPYAFSTAFRRETGTPPSRYREGLLRA